jgi:protein-S-isoprenylcysteine O-methyltransferase Ste14
MNRLTATLGSLVWLLLAPGVVAGLIPWWITGWDADDPSAVWIPVQIVGGLLIAVGIAVLVESFTRFALYGLGTPAPAAPTERLVVTGLYRHVRNPMYVAVAALIAGQALLFGQPWLFLYVAAFVATVAAFVRLYEEPTLARRFGADYERYRREVPGWLPRRRFIARRAPPGPRGS